MIQAWTYPVRAIWNSVGWSVSAEWFMYLLFPLLAATLCRLPRFALLLLTAALLSCNFFILAPEVASKPSALGLWRVVIGFLLGMFLFLLQKDKRRPSPVWWGIGLVTLFSWGYARILIPGVYPVVSAPIFAFVIIGALSASGAQLKLFNSKLLLWLGEISYSLYLCHYIIIFSVHQLGFSKILKSQSGMTRFFLLAIVFASFIIAGHLLWKYVETPMRKWLLARYSRR